SVHGFEWYLSLERWLPLHLFNLQNYRTARHPAICKQLLSVNQGYEYQFGTLRGREGIHWWSTQTALNRLRRCLLKS
ncbi:hypothetical protein, partial [Thermostichus vulcanus]